MDNPLFPVNIHSLSLPKYSAGHQPFQQSNTTTMSERKVITKYYPSDFDPAALKRGPKITSSKLSTVRVAAPFSMRCDSCGEYIGKGRRFNAWKEMMSEKYYNIPTYRFYVRCYCSAEITFRTDPNHDDYECESGAKRNFEPWREAKLAKETEEGRPDRIEREEAGRDIIKELEAKVLDEKKNMAIADDLDEISSRNARHEYKKKQGNIDSPQIMKKAAAELQHQIEDAKTARQAFARKRQHEWEEDFNNDEKPKGTSEWAFPVKKRKQKPRTFSLVQRKKTD